MDLNDRTDTVTNLSFEMDIGFILQKLPSIVNNWVLR